MINPSQYWLGVHCAINRFHDSACQGMQMPHAMHIVAARAFTSLKDCLQPQVVRLLLQLESRATCIWSQCLQSCMCTLVTQRCAFCTLQSVAIIHLQVLNKVSALSLLGNSPTFGTTLAMSNNECCNLASMQYCSRHTQSPEYMACEDITHDHPHDHLSTCTV